MVQKRLDAAMERAGAGEVPSGTTTDISVDVVGDRPPTDSSDASASGTFGAKDFTPTSTLQSGAALCAPPPPDNGDGDASADSPRQSTDPHSAASSESGAPEAQRSETKAPRTMAAPAEHVTGSSEGKKAAATKSKAQKKLPKSPADSAAPPGEIWCHMFAFYSMALIIVLPLW